MRPQITKAEAGLNKFPTWLVLDNTAKIWPAILSQRYTTLFRLSAVMKERVRLEALQEALHDTLLRFPYFRVRIRRGLFWYHLEPRLDFPRVEADFANPCMNYHLLGKDAWPFRIKVFNCRISLEMSHILTDGTGALIFLQFLVDRYLSLKKMSKLRPEETQTCEALLEDISPEEWKDEYPSLMIDKPRKLPKVPLQDRAYHPPGKLLSPGQYRVVSLWYSVEEVLAKSKSQALSLTEFLASLLAEVLQEQQADLLEDEGKLWKTKPIKLNIPVNLRKMYPSKTLRNFFSFADPGIDPRLGLFSSEEIRDQLHHQMKFLSNKKHMTLLVSRNMQGERSLLNRLAPRVIKDLVLRMVYQGMGDQRFSASFSNLGLVKTQDAEDDALVGLVFLPPPSPICKVNVSTISCGSRLCVSFAGLIEDMDLARRFSEKMTKEGFKSYIEANFNAPKKD